MLTVDCRVKFNFIESFNRIDGVEPPLCYRLSSTFSVFSDFAVSSTKDTTKEFWSFLGGGVFLIVDKQKNEVHTRAQATKSEK